MANRYCFCICILDPLGGTAGHREHSCADDPAALKIAGSMSDGQPVEVWTGDRCLAHVVEYCEAALPC